MGECFVRFYREKVKNTWKIAFFSAFIIGFLIHIYKFTNTLLVADSLYNFYSTQDMLASGRWFLSIACAPSSYFDLPWVTGLLSLFYMGIAAAAIAEVFEMNAKPIATRPISVSEADCDVIANAINALILAA